MFADIPDTHKHPHFLYRKQIYGYWLNLVVCRAKKEVKFIEIEKFMNANGKILS